MTPLRVTIPGAPRGKGRPRFARVGAGVRTFTDDKTQTAENWIQTHVRLEMRNQPPINAPVTVRVVFHVTAPKKPKATRPASRPDLDNLVKTVLDACNLAGVWTDDARVCRLAAEKLYAEPGRERTELTIEEIPS